MFTWQQIGVVTSGVFALGDLIIAVIMIRNIITQSRLSRRYGNVRSTYTFPKVRKVLAMFFASACMLRVVDMVAWDRLLWLLVLMRIVHGIVLWYSVATMFKFRRVINDFMDSVLKAEIGDKK